MVVGGQFGVESGGELMPLPNSHDVSVCFGEDFDLGGKRAMDVRSTDEGHGEVVCDVGNLADGIETAQLSPVGIAANVYVHRAESLPWMPILLFGKKDEPRTSAKDGQTFENGLADRVEESQVVEQTELSGGFTTRNDEPVFRLFPI